MLMSIQRKRLRQRNNNNALALQQFGNSSVSKGSYPLATCKD